MPDSNRHSPNEDALSNSSDLPSFRESLTTGIRCLSMKTNPETSEENSASETNEEVVNQPEIWLRRSARIAEIAAKYSFSYSEEKDTDSTPERNCKQNKKRTTKKRRKKLALSRKRKARPPTVEETDSDSNGEVSAAVEMSAREQEVRNRLNDVRRKAEKLLNEIDNFEELQASNQYNYIDKSLMKLEETLDRMSEDVKGSTELRSETKKVYSFIRDIYAKLDHKSEVNQARLSDTEMIE